MCLCVRVFVCIVIIKRTMEDFGVVLSVDQQRQIWERKNKTPARRHRGVSFKIITSTPFGGKNGNVYAQQLEWITLN